MSTRSLWCQARTWIYIGFGTSIKNTRGERERERKRVFRVVVVVVVSLSPTTVFTVFFFDGQQCYAVAAAIFRNPTTVQNTSRFISMPFSQQFQALWNGTMDLSTTFTSYNMMRDVYEVCLDVWMYDKSFCVVVNGSLRYGWVGMMRSPASHEFCFVPLLH